MNHGDLKHLRDYFHGRLRTTDVEMAGGGLAKKVGPLVKRISRLGDLRNYIEDVAGSEQARRFDQASDLTNLSRYSNGALRGVFTEPVTANGELPLLMAMPPRDFEKYAAPLFDGKYYQGIMPWEHISAGGDPGSYLNYLYAQSISGGLSHVPFLRGTVPGSPDYGGGSALSLSLPEIIGHEGRHRMRALDKAGDPASLVQMRNVVPNDVWLRSQTPDRAVVPQYGFTPDRDPVSMPEFFAEGGRAKLSKESVDYSPGMGTTRCRNCAHFKKPSGCALVAGKIDPSYWCEKFKRAYAEGGEVEDDYGAGRFTPDPETQRMRRSIRASTNAIRASHPELRDSLPNVSARDMFDFINPDPHLRDKYGPSGAVLDALSIASLGVEGKAAKAAQWAIPAATELGTGLLSDMKPYGYNPLKYGIDKADQLMNWVTSPPEDRSGFTRADEGPPRVGYADGGAVLGAMPGATLVKKIEELASRLSSPDRGFTWQPHTGAEPSNPRNARRITDVLGLGLEDPDLRTMRSWYTMSPLWNYMGALGLPDRAPRDLNARFGVMSPQASPAQEVERGFAGDVANRRGIDPEAARDQLLLGDIGHARGGSIDDDLLGYHTMTYAKGGFHNLPNSMPQSGPMHYGSDGGFARGGSVDDELGYVVQNYRRGGYFGGE